MSFRTDRHSNPTAFTTDLAKQAGLKLNVDYAIGEAFPDNALMATAKLLGDPVEITIRVIDAVGYYTKTGAPRWSYIGPLPHFFWAGLTRDQKRDLIGFHYQREGGATMRTLFPNYGKA